MTLLLKINPNQLDSSDALDALGQAAAILRDGGTVAFPTETVYGLGANALDPAAAEKIFAAKQRPAWDPLIVHIADEEMLPLVAGDLPGSAHALIAAFWPGPLTLLLPRSPWIDDSITAGRSLVGLRMPSHPVARALIRMAGVPIAAPSANRFGHTSPTTARHVLDDLDGRIDAVLDGGPTPHGLESTVLDPATHPVTLYRPGALTVEQICSIAGEVKLYTPSGMESEPQAQPSPGIGLRHYAPHARLVLLESVAESVQQDALTEAAEEASSEKLGLMLPDGWPEPVKAAAIYRWGAWNSAEELANRLFAGLRELDDAGCTLILCPLPTEKGIGLAIRDRLRKAAKI